jgi:hypothetical protein
MVPPPPRSIPLGGRLGCWIGAFGWLIGFAAVTLPDGLRFAPEMAGGFVLTLGVALAIDWNLRRAPILPLALPGALLLSLALIGSYWNLVCEPAINGSPATLARMRWLNTLGEPGAASITHFPVGQLRIETGVGLLLLLAGWFRHQPERQRM